LEEQLNKEANNHLCGGEDFSSWVLNTMEVSIRDGRSQSIFQGERTEYAKVWKSATGLIPG